MYEEIFSSQMLAMLQSYKSMAAFSLLQNSYVLRSQLFKLPAVTELSLIRWASKKTGQLTYIHINVIPYMFHLKRNFVANPRFIL